MYLFFDTETTGLPRNWKAPVTQLNNWPRMVQLAWLVYDKQGNKLGDHNHIILPEGYTIPHDAARMHGISTERAMSEGEDLTRVLQWFADDLDKSEFAIAHNISFDEKIVGAEFLRKKVTHSLFETHRLCTMKRSTDYCQIPGRYGNKWPSLSELHEHLFNEDFEDAHDASVDVEICAKCFFELQKRMVIFV